MQNGSLGEDVRDSIRSGNVIRHDSQMGSTVEGLTAIAKFSIFWCILTITIPPLL